MLRLRWMVACGVLAALAPAALAFQESKEGVASGQQPAPSARAAPPLDLRNTGTSVASPTGVEVRIPGLGKLGVLPKFDFGLELLYGANEQKASDAERQGQTLPSDDVQIRGSLKHRF